MNEYDQESRNILNQRLVDALEWCIRNNVTITPMNETIKFDIVGFTGIHNPNLLMGIEKLKESVEEIKENYYKFSKFNKKNVIVY